MSYRVDGLDRRILDILQRDAEVSLDEIAHRVGSSRTPVWNRIRRMKNEGVIRRVAADVDPDKVDLTCCFFVLIRTSAHASDWLQDFTRAIADLPEIVEAHRLAGDIDYILKVYVRDARAFDRFYQRLVDRVSIFNVTSALSMEVMKPHSGYDLGLSADSDSG